MSNQDCQNLFHAIKEELTCSLCSDIFKNPLTLACSHSFCCVCLREIARAKEQEIVTQCPRCNTNILKPEHVAFEKAFAGSTFVNNLLKLLPIAENFEKCENCEKEYEIFSCCFDCKTFMCLECHNVHKRLKIVRNHRVKTFSPLQLVNQRPCCQDFSLCQQHETQLEQQEKVSTTCRNVNGYTACPPTACRNGHEDAATLLALNEELKNCILIKEKEKEKNEQSHKEFQDGIKQIRRYVESKTQEMVQEVTKLKDQLTLQLNEFQDKQFCNYSQNQNSLEHQLFKMKDLLRQGKSVRRCKPAENHAAVVTIISNELEQTFWVRNILPSVLENEKVVAMADVDRTYTDGPGINEAVFDGNNTEYKAIKAFGGEGEGKGEFRFPWGIAVSGSGEVAVTDHLSNRVQVFNSDGDWVRVFGSKGHDDGQFNGPVGVAYDQNENIFVCDNDNHRIQVYDKFGTFVRNIGQKELNWPWGICVTSDGHVAVCDSYDIAVFSGDGELIRRFGRSDHASDEEGPYYIAHANNRYFVSYSDSRCVKVFDNEGQLLFPFGEGQERNGQEREGKFEGPRGLAVDKSGSLLVCDRKAHRVHMFSMDGEFQGEFGSRGHSLGEFHGPRDIAVATDGRVYVIGEGNSRVQMFQPDECTKNTDNCF